MSRRFLVSLSALVAVIAVVSLAPVPAAGQAGTAAAKSWTPPRTPWGDPDLQGIYNTATPTPMERPRALAGREFVTDKELAAYEALVKTKARDDKADRGALKEGDTAAGPEHWYEYGKPTRRTSLVVDPPDGRIPPFTPEARKRLATREEARSGRGEADSWLDRNLWERCITTGGLPYAMSMTGGYNANYQFLQIPGYVVILIEMMHDARIIPLDGRPHADKSIRQYFGDSRGHWEGNTLVVDTTNFTDRQDGGPIMASHRPLGFYPGSGETLHVIERFTRIDANTLDYRYTVDDPKTYTKPYTVALPMNKDDSQAFIFEYACHEGNKGMVNILTGGRANEKAALEAAAREARERKAGGLTPDAAADR